MSRPNELAKALASALDRISELERRQENSIRHGKVEEVDADQGKVRLRLGVDADGTPQIGPWIRYSQMAGGLKIHAPPTVGQNYTQIAPGGDFEQGFAIPLSWNNANEAPSKSGTENVMTYGSFRAELRAGELVITVPRVLITCGSSSYEIKDGLIRQIADLIKENE